MIKTKLKMRAQNGGHYFELVVNSSSTVIIKKSSVVIKLYGLREDCHSFLKKQ